MSKLLLANWGLRVGLVGAVLVVAACSAGSDSERASSVEEALTIAVPYRVRAIDFTSFNDSDTVHEGPAEAAQSTSRPSRTMASPAASPTPSLENGLNLPCKQLPLP